MSPRRLLASFVLAICLSASALGQAPQTPAPEPQNPPSQTQKPQTPSAKEQAAEPEKKITSQEAEDLFRSMDEILHFASQQTGLPVKHEVKHKLTSRDDVQKFIEQRMKEDPDAKRMEESEFVMKKFGLLPGDFNLRKFMISMLREQVAGYYDTKTKTMNLLELTEVSDKLACIGIRGPKAAQILKAAGVSADLQPLELTDATWNGIGISIARGFSEQFPECEIWFAPEHTAAIWDALVAAGAQPVGYEALELFRIATGVPAYGQDIRDRELPQETEQKHALHFAKGCYIGQEIVERIRSRGNVHRALTAFTLSQEVPVGTKLMKDGKEVGELTSIAVLPPNKIVALGYARREALVSNTPLSAGEATAAPRTISHEI